MRSPVMGILNQIRIRVPVQHVSLTAMEEAGWELGDNGFEENRNYAEFYKEGLLAFLTRRQRQVALCLNDQGLSRKETAAALGVSLQAVHQIVLRMRKRLKERGGIVWRK